MQVLIVVRATDQTGYVQFMCPCSLDAAIARNELRTGSARVPEASIRRMHAQLESPDADKNAWERHSFSLSVDGKDSKLSVSERYKSGCAACVASFDLRAGLPRLCRGPR